MGQGASEIADAIGDSVSIQVLDLSFNAITQNKWYKQVCKEQTEEKKKEEEAKKKEQQAKKKKDEKPVVYELSFNKKLGIWVHPKPEEYWPFQREYAEPWAAAFKKNKSLIHVDLSHNHIPLSDVEIIAEGLKENHKILGIHFIGNDGDIDQQGFVNP